MNEIAMHANRLGITRYAYRKLANNGDFANFRKLTQNDTITLFSIQMLVSMQIVIVTAIVIMAAYDKICHDNNCGDDNLK